MDVLIERRFPPEVRLNDHGLCDLEGQVTASYGEIATCSCSVIAVMKQEQAGTVEWLRSWVCHGTDGDVIFCHHRVDQLDSVREHSTRGNFPYDAKRIWEISYQVQCVVANPQQRVFSRPGFVVLRPNNHNGFATASLMLQQEWGNEQSNIIVSMLVTPRAVFSVMHTSQADTPQYYGRSGGEVFSLIRVLDPSLAKTAT